MEGHFDVRVVDHFLEYLAVGFDDGGPGRFGLPHHLTNRPAEQVMIDGTVEAGKHTQLPVRVGVTRFLRKPNVELCTRQRQHVVPEFHQIPELPVPPTPNLSRRAFGRTSAQFCSM